MEKYYNLYFWANWIFWIRFFFSSVCQLINFCVDERWKIIFGLIRNFFHLFLRTNICEEFGKMGRFSYKCWFESNFGTSNLYPSNSKIIVRRCLILVFLSYVIFSLEAALFSEIWNERPYCDNILFQVNHVRTQRLIFLRIQLIIYCSYFFHWY